MPGFLDFIGSREIEKPAYPIYPDKFWEPYRTKRFEIGEQMCAKLGIAREEKPARYARMAENYKFFGAPAAIFCFVDKGMGRQRRPGQHPRKRTHALRSVGEVRDAVGVRVTRPRWFRYPHADCGSGGCGEELESLGVGWSHDSKVSIVECRDLDFANAFSDRDEGCVNEVEG